MNELINSGNTDLVRFFTQNVSNADYKAIVRHLMMLSTSNNENTVIKSLEILNKIVEAEIDKQKAAAQLIARKEEYNRQPQQPDKTLQHMERMKKWADFCKVTEGALKKIEMLDVEPPIKAYKKQIILERLDQIEQDIFEK